MLESEKEKHMKHLKRKIECWREIILPLNSILMWEKSWYPGLIFGTTTTLFLLIWIMEPAFLTIISGILMLLALADYFVIVLFSTFISSSSAWTGQKERKLDEICKGLSETILQIQCIWKSILCARNNRPNLCYGSITLSLCLLAWLGNVVNNLLLVYLIVTGILLIPGFRQKELIQSAVKIGCNYLMHPDELIIDESLSNDGIKKKNS